MSVILIIAPHPDDETLSSAGTLLKHKAAGDEIHWLIMTEVKKTLQTQDIFLKRNHEIAAVAEAFGFSSVRKLGFQTTALDKIPKNEIINQLADCIKNIRPDIMYLPFWGDIHSDHYCTFEAASTYTKSFRYPFIKKVRVYETLSETEFSIRPDRQFVPNLWIDISGFIEKKLNILKIYQSELNEHPFPRSLENVKALATYRGATVDCCAAEAFMSLKEVL